MQKSIIIKFFFLLLCSLFLIHNCTSPVNPVTNAGDSPQAKLARTNPDHYVWQKFVEFFAYSDDTKRVVHWENWINESDVYDPPCDSIRTWPGDTPLQKLNQPKSMTIMHGIDNAHGEFSTTEFEFLTLNFSHPYYEESRLNKPMFDYINDNQLYLKPKVEAMAKDTAINFPSETAIVKAQWKKISEAEKSKYYWHVLTLDSIPEPSTNPDTIQITRLMGLAAFHLVTKELPSYVWSTFEHVDNPGRCDYIGCHDSFGYSPADVEPHEKDSLLYAEPRTISPELDSMFKAHGIGDVFRNYRLKAAQTHYVDKEGTPTLNGNSVLEANLVATSSCISCHARATVNATTGKPLSMFIDSLTKGSFRLGHGNTSKGWHPTCYTGFPVTHDYITIDSTTKQIIPDSTYYGTDFLWQLAQLAGSCDGTENGSGN